MTLRARFYVADGDTLVETVRDVVGQDQVDDLITALLGTGAHDAVLHHVDRSLWDGGVTDHEVAIGVRSDRGAMWFADEDDTWCAKGEGPEAPPEYHGGTFPSRCEIPLAELSSAVKEFLETAQRPVVVEWQNVT